MVVLLVLKTVKNIGKRIYRYYNMTNMPLDVHAFQLACEQHSSEENAELYAKLIEEEFNEFKKALTKESFIVIDWITPSVLAE